MIEQSPERLEFEDPKYQRLVNGLYTTASEAMELNYDLVAISKRLGSFTLASLKLKSIYGEFIILEKALKTPLPTYPEKPDWYSAEPHIHKVGPDQDGNEIKHDYFYRDGLMIDHKQATIPEYFDRDAKDTVEIDLSAEDIEQLTNDLRTWEPIKQPLTVGRVISVVPAFLLTNG